MTWPDIGWVLNLKILTNICAVKMRHWRLPDKRKYRFLQDKKKGPEGPFSVISARCLWQACRLKLQVQAQIVSTTKNIILVGYTLAACRAGNDRRILVEHVQDIEADVPGTAILQFAGITQGTVPPGGRGHLVTVDIDALDPGAVYVFAGNVPALQLQ